MWTHRITNRRSTSETPFALAYEVEAVISLEIGLPTTRTTEFDAELNEDDLKRDLDLLKKRYGHNQVGLIPATNEKRVR